MSETTSSAAISKLKMRSARPVASSRPMAVPKGPRAALSESTRVGGSADHQRLKMEVAADGVKAVTAPIAIIRDFGLTHLKAADCRKLKGQPRTFQAPARPAVAIFQARNER